MRWVPDAQIAVDDIPDWRQRILPVHASGPAIMKPRQRGMLLLAAFTVLTIATAWWLVQRPAASDWASAPPPLQGVMWPVARPVADFELHDQIGRAQCGDRVCQYVSILVV